MARSLLQLPCRFSKPLQSGDPLQFGKELHLTGSTGHCLKQYRFFHKSSLASIFFVARRDLYELPIFLHFEIGKSRTSRQKKTPGQPSALNPQSPRPRPLSPQKSVPIEYYIGGSKSHKTKNLQYLGVRCIYVLVDQLPTAVVLPFQFAYFEKFNEFVKIEFLCNNYIFPAPSRSSFRL